MSDVLANLAAIREALTKALDCKGPYNRTVSETGGYPAVCPACLQQAKDALAALSVVEGEWRNTVRLTREEAEAVLGGLTYATGPHELLASRLAAGPGDKQ